MRTAMNQDQPRSQNLTTKTFNNKKQPPPPPPLPHQKKVQENVVVSRPHGERGLAGFRTGGSFHIQD